MKDLTSYAAKPATPTMEAFADFLIAEVFGGTLPKGVDLASFRKGVALGGSTRGYFQSSDFWKNDPRNYLANVEARAIEKAEARVAATEKAAARVAAAKAKAAEALAAAKAKLAAKAEAEAPAEGATEE